MKVRGTVIAVGVMLCVTFAEAQGTPPLRNHWRLGMTSPNTLLDIGSAAGDFPMTGVWKCHYGAAGHSNGSAYRTLWCSDGVGAIETMAMCADNTPNQKVTDVTVGRPLGTTGMTDRVDIILYCMTERITP